MSPIPSLPLGALPVTAQLADLAKSVVDRIGYSGIFLLETLESMCIPIPSEATQLFAGFLVSDHRLNLYLVIAVATLGNLVGSTIAWYVGLRGGRPLVLRYGRFFHVTEAKLGRAERWFERYGPRVVFWSRLLPVLRTFISLPAGAARMGYGRFALYTTLGTIPWMTGLTLLGVWAGTRWKTIEGRLKYLDYAVAAVIVLGAVYLFVRWRRTRADTPHASTASETDVG
jgi:membrane protein DedA with SNARE-associated domain